MGCMHMHVFLCIGGRGFIYACVGMYAVPCKE